MSINFRIIQDNNITNIYGGIFEFENVNFINNPIYKNLNDNNYLLNLKYNRTLFNNILFENNHCSYNNTLNDNSNNVYNNDDGCFIINVLQ